MNDKVGFIFGTCGNFNFFWLVVLYQIFGSSLLKFPKKVSIRTKECVGQNTVLAGIFFLTFLAVCECVTEHKNISRAGISGGIFCGSDYTHYDYFWIGETDYDYFWQRVILSCGHGVHMTYFLWIKSGDFTELLR